MLRASTIKMRKKEKLVWNSVAAYPLAVLCLFILVAHRSAAYKIRQTRALVNTPEEFNKLVEGRRYERKNNAVVFILSNRSPEIFCSFVNRFYNNFIATNPADVVVLSVSSIAGRVKEVEACHNNLPRFYSIDMYAHAQALGWITPHHVLDEKLWSGKWTEEYRLMGHWRLTVQFHLAHMLGYEYLLQVDDDSEFLGNVKENLFETMARDNLKIAAREIVPDLVPVTMGLPELARYFIVTENFTPSPLLFAHCNPASIEGLFTDVAGTGPGWDRSVFYGNFVVYSVNFMHETMVQRFIALVVRTGGHFMYRWNEQATIGMIWQVFVREDEFKLFDFPYEHWGRRRKWQ